MRTWYGFGALVVLGVGLPGGDGQMRDVGERDGTVVTYVWLSGTLIGFAVGVCAQVYDVVGAGTRRPVFRE